MNAAMMGCDADGNAFLAIIYTLCVIAIMVFWWGLFYGDRK